MTQQLGVNFATFRIAASLGAAYAKGVLCIDASATQEERAWLVDTLERFNFMREWDEVVGSQDIHMELRPQQEHPHAISADTASGG